MSSNINGRNVYPDRDRAYSTSFGSQLLPSVNDVRTTSFETGEEENHQNHNQQREQKESNNNNNNNNNSKYNRVDSIRHDIRNTLKDHNHDRTNNRALAHASFSSKFPSLFERPLGEKKKKTAQTTTFPYPRPNPHTQASTSTNNSNSNNNFTSNSNVEEKRMQAKMAEMRLHEKMDETKERINTSRQQQQQQQQRNATNNSTHTANNVSQWMDSVVAKAKHDATTTTTMTKTTTISQPVQLETTRGNSTNTNTNSYGAAESLREAAKNAREAVTRAVYGTATIRTAAATSINSDSDTIMSQSSPNINNYNNSGSIRRSFSDPVNNSSSSSSQEETDAKVTKAMLKSALKQTGELRTELRAVKEISEGLNNTIAIMEKEKEKMQETREEDKLRFEAEKNELETSREAAREALTREVNVTQELTKKLSAKRDEAAEQRNLADKYKRELEQLRNELRSLKNENESWIRKAESANDARRTQQQKQQANEQQQQKQQEIPKVSSTQSSAHHHHQPQQQQQQQQQQKYPTPKKNATSEPQQQQQQQQQNWTVERQEAEKLKTKGNREFHAGNFEEALESYTNALQINFNDNAFRAVLHANRAAALQSSKKHLEAIVACCESQFYDVSYIRAIQRRADAYLSIGDWAMAAKDLETLAPVMGKECELKLQEAKTKIQRGFQIEHYAVLGISSRASSAEIRSSYLKNSLKHHPDKAETEQTKEVAEVMFKKVCEAYKVLSNENERRAFDNSRVLSNATNRYRSY